MRLAWPSAMDMATPSDKPSATPDTASNARWISLRELAEVRGISQHSATRLVRRHGWRRQRDNRGHVLALVPIEALSRQSDMPSAVAEGQDEGRPSAGRDEVARLVTAREAAIAAASERAQADAATIEARYSRSDETLAVPTCLIGGHIAREPLREHVTLS
jgi:hypothetical protein